MNEIKTYSEMNALITSHLRQHADPASLYAATRIEELATRIEELEAERERLRVLLSEWLHEGRFLVANTPEEADLVRRTRAALPEGRQLMGEGGARDAESA